MGTTTNLNGGTTGGGATLITDSGVISNITNNSNWGATGYTGSTAGIEDNSYYIDTVLNIRYLYLNSILMRETYNNIS